MTDANFELEFLRGLAFAQDRIPLPDNAPDAAVHGFDFGRAILDYAEEIALDLSESLSYQRSYRHCTGADTRIAGKPVDGLTEAFEIAGWENEDGSLAQRNGDPFDPDRTESWQHGWVSARDCAAVMAQIESFREPKH